MSHISLIGTTKRGLTGTGELPFQSRAVVCRRSRIYIYIYAGVYASLVN